MVLVFVHGWSVRETRSYGCLPERLEKDIGGAEIEHVYLGKYVSFDDAVTLDDIARAFDAALREKLYDPHTGSWREFACITHSTGGPLARLWMTLFYGPERLRECPMKHLIMLAPANHGSALAQLGKSRISRLKFFVEGAEPGERVLDWLELASAGVWDLAQSWLDMDCAAAGIWVFSLTGQRIDRTLYDHLNNYTGEPGSDGVVRVAAANANFQSLRFEQSSGGRLTLARRRRSPATAFGVLPGVAHCGDSLGILTSVPPAGGHPTLTWLKRCLAVRDRAAYNRLSSDLATLTATTQKDERVERIPRLLGDALYETHRYSMVVFRLLDDRGAELIDFELLLTAGPHYSPDELPTGFCLDRQRNSLQPGHLTYYIDHDRLSAIDDSPIEGRLGLRVHARPNRGLAYYECAEFRSGPHAVADLIRPNETTFVEVVLPRCVDGRVFELIPRSAGWQEISRQPTGRKIA